MFDNFYKILTTSVLLAGIMMLSLLKYVVLEVIEELSKINDSLQFADSCELIWQLQH